MVTTAYGADPGPGAPEKACGRAVIRLSLQLLRPQAALKLASQDTRLPAVTLRALEILQERVEDKGRFQNHKILAFPIFLLLSS